MVNTAAVSATSGVNSVTAIAIAAVPQTTTRIEPVSITFQQCAASGKTTGLTELKETVKKGKICSLSLNTVTFFEKFTTTEASFTLVIGQSNTGAWLPLSMIKGISVTLYDVNCVKFNAQGSTIYDPATGTVTLNIYWAAPEAVY